jgi:hypothetical protein
MAKAKMVYEKHDDLRFVWSGGEYIEIFSRDLDTDLFPKSAFDIINVWDYAKGEPRIEKNLDAFKEFVDQHLQEVMEDIIASPEFDEPREF